MPTNTIAQSLRFRTLCALVLEAAGLSVSTARAWQRPSEAFAQPEPGTKADIWGPSLKDWAIVTHANASPGRYSEQLAAAEAIAALEGRPYSALFQWRPGATREHFAIVGLSTFASLLAEVESLKQDSMSDPQSKEDSG